jgi:hypothetical protein
LGEDGLRRLLAGIAAVADIAIESMPGISDATDLRRTLTSHCGSRGIFGSFGRGGQARFSSSPQAITRLIAMALSGW